MSNPYYFQRKSYRLYRCLLLVLFCCGAATIAGCGYFGLLLGDCARMLNVRGRVIDDSTRTPLFGVVVGGRTFTIDKETDRIPPTTGNGNPNGPPTDEGGNFQLDFSNSLGPCAQNLEPFPPPDRVEITVIRDGCETTFAIDMDEDTVVDVSFPDDTLELKDPILVPECGEDGDVAP